MQALLVERLEEEEWERDLLGDIFVAGLGNEGQCQNENISSTVTPGSQLVIILLSYFKNMTKMSIQGRNFENKRNKLVYQGFTGSIPQSQVYSTPVHNYFCTKVVKDSEDIMLFSDYIAKRTGQGVRRFKMNLQNSSVTDPILKNLQMEVAIAWTF